MEIKFKNNCVPLIEISDSSLFFYITTSKHKGLFFYEQDNIFFLYSSYSNSILLLKSFEDLLDTFSYSNAETYDDRRIYYVYTGFDDNYTHASIIDEVHQIFRYRDYLKFVYSLMDKSKEEVIDKARKIMHYQNLLYDYS
jgi:hypothetical protein